MKTETIKFCEEGLIAERSKQRSLSIELVKLLLVQEDVKAPVDASKLLNALARRARDISGAIQSRALLALADILEGGIIPVGESLLAPGALQPTLRSRRSTDSLTSLGSECSNKTTNSNITKGNCYNISLPGMLAIRNFAKRRSNRTIYFFGSRSNRTIRKSG